MFEISFLEAEAALALIWLLLRCIVWARQGKINWKREAVLFLMFVNLAVIIRFAFFPRALINGRVQPLGFDRAKAISFRVNLIPLIHLFEYSTIRDMIWNTVGNAAMFIPSGIILPVVYRRLDSFGKVLMAGAFLSLCIEFFQLPFSSRVSDVDDLILNTLGLAVGYGIYNGIRYLKRKKSI